jgi:uncharacterized protein YpmB
MIHFDFILEDADAENLIGILRKQVTLNHVQLIKCFDKGEVPSVIDAYEKENKYIEYLISKMKNTRIDESDQSRVLSEDELEQVKKVANAEHQKFLLSQTVKDWLTNEDERKHYVWHLQKAIESHLKQLKLDESETDYD